MLAVVVTVPLVTFSLMVVLELSDLVTPPSDTVAVVVTQLLVAEELQSMDPVVHQVLLDLQDEPLAVEAVELQ
jgi:hypothetical protein